jgi:hypothetical protein
MPRPIRTGAHIAEVIGRAFVTEPMMTWPLGGRTDDPRGALHSSERLFLEPLMDRGIVWDTADGHGALVLVRPEQAEAWDDANAHIENSTTDQTDDGGRRSERFWEWVASRIPQEPLWHLDSVAASPVGSVAVSVQPSLSSRLSMFTKAGSP